MLHRYRDHTRRIGTWLVPMLTLGLAVAQGFGGTYGAESPNGPVELELQQGGEELVGVLLAPGVRFELEGFVDDGAGVGFAYGAEGALGFEAYLEGDTLGLYLFEVDAYGDAVMESVIELILTRRVGGGGAGQSPVPPPAAAAPSPVIARGAYGELRRDDALAFVEALEFVLEQIGYPYRFSEAERAQVLDAIAQAYPQGSQADQAVMAQARQVWQNVQANWARASVAEQREFALGVLVLAFGEATVRQWVGTGGGGGQALGSGGSCTTFEDCTSGFVDERTWTDTSLAQGCWAAAGCEGYDASTGELTFETFD